MFEQCQILVNRRRKTQKWNTQSANLWEAEEPLPKAVELLTNQPADRALFAKVRVTTGERGANPSQNWDNGYTDVKLGTKPPLRCLEPPLLLTWNVLISSSEELCRCQLPPSVPGTSHWLLFSSYIKWYVRQRGIYLLHLSLELASKLQDLESIEKS